MTNGGGTNGDKAWLVPLTGLGFFVVAIIGFIVAGEAKSSDDSAADIVSYYSDNHDSMMAGAIIAVVATTLLLFFAAHLRDVLRDAGASRMLSTVSFTGLVIVAIGFAIDTTVQIAIAETVDKIDPVGVQTLNALWEHDFVPIALGVSVFLWASGIAVVRSGALPRWLGWLMIVLAVISCTPFGFVSAIATALLILAISVLLAVRARSAGPVPA